LAKTRAITNILRIKETDAKLKKSLTKKDNGI